MKMSHGHKVHKKRRKKRLTHHILKTIAVTAGFMAPPAIFANPVIDHVAHGEVTIQQTHDSTVVQQSSQKAVINWQNFNIGQQESVHFQQPTNGITLNRINPEQGASEIYGRLTATGQIILMNSSGIYFGPSAYVNVGGLIAGTTNISDRDFLNDYYHFNSVVPETGSIVNEGKIIAANHGLVALIGSNVTNKGHIEANYGHVVLASGSAFTMNFAGNNLIHFEVNEKTLKDSAGVTNTGTLRADGGSILVTAKAAQGVLDTVINMQGVAEARSVAEQNGEIILSGDRDAGVVRVAAHLDASGKNAGEKGGNVTITGYNILVDSPTMMDA